ncbi:MAG TPA: MmcQ/YjbR family DNA-binding protein [Blastocatellia bacterium]|nr:MmcQ/YjbR family DNA-binding protein [Blastocatellia bacterium]
MDIESVRSYCLSLPHVTEKVQWGNDLLFRIGEKMFAVVNLDETSPNRLAFKCTPEKFAELVEMEEIIPAPYMARNHWVALQSWDALSAAEIRSLIRNSYDMVLAKLPKKVQATLGQNNSQSKETTLGNPRRRK